MASELYETLANSLIAYLTPLTAGASLADESVGGGARPAVPRRSVTGIDFTFKQYSTPGTPAGSGSGASGSGSGSGAAGSGSGSGSGAAGSTPRLPSFANLLASLSGNTPPNRHTGPSGRLPGISNLIASAEN